jgi:photosystem II stability/assembly factor-like uncharacterized protein
MFAHLSKMSVLLGALALFGAGCFGSTAPVPATGPDGGVFRTKTDIFGPKVEVVEWKQLKLLNAGTKFGSIADVGTVTGAFDPQDPLTMYLGTVQNGLMYTSDGGESWQSAKGISVGRIEAVAVSPKDKCVIFVSRANQIFKTENCGRDWNQSFFDGRTDKRFTALAIDPKNDNAVYAGTSDGDLFRSDNAGATWRATYRVEGIRIMNIAVDPHDSKIIYAASYGSGVLKSTDNGATWTSIRKPFQDFDKARFPRAVVLDPNIVNRIYHISRFGMLRSDDAGATWSPVTIANPNNTLDVRAMAIHPKDSKKLTYATDTNIAFSNDGGVTWTSRKLPTTRGASFILFDPSTQPALFVGAQPPKAQ